MGRHDRQPQDQGQGACRKAAWPEPHRQGALQATDEAVVDDDRSKNDNNKEGTMPQPRSRRRAEPEDEPEAREDEAPDEELDEDDDGQSGGATLNIDVAEDRVIIELPRDGNERPALEAIGAMLDSMS